MEFSQRKSQQEIAKANLRMDLSITISCSDISHVTCGYNRISTERPFALFIQRTEPMTVLGKFGKILDISGKNHSKNSACNASGLSDRFIVVLIETKNILCNIGSFSSKKLTGKLRNEKKKCSGVVTPQNNVP